MPKNKFLTVLGLWVGMLISLVAVAEPMDDRWYVAPAIGHIWADNDRNADDGYEFRLGVGKPLGMSWAFEVEGTYDRLARKTNGGAFKQSGLNLDVMYHFLGNDATTTTYGVVALGVLHTEIPSEKSNNPLGEIGVGMKRRFQDHGTAIRADVRYRYDGDNSSVTSQNSFGDWVVNVALVIPLGAKAVATVPVAAAPAVETPPPPPPAAPAPKPPEPPPPVAAAPVVALPAMRIVHFDFDSIAIKDDDKETLDANAAYLTAHTDVTATLAGYCDERGPHEYNMALGERRAKSVEQYLRLKGVAANQLKTVSYGEKNPRAPGHNEAAWRQNRRVEVVYPDH